MSLSTSEETLIAMMKQLQDENTALKKSIKESMIKPYRHIYLESRIMELEEALRDISPEHELLEGLRG